MKHLVCTEVLEPLKSSILVPAFSKALYVVSSNMRCIGSIVDTCDVVIEKKLA